MKILMVLDEVFPPDIRIEKEARTLLRAGHELSLLSLGVSGKPREEVIEGMKVIRTELPPPKIILGYAWERFRFTSNFIDNFWQQALVKTVEREKPEVLHIHDLAKLRTGLLVARKFNIRVVADLHENFPEAQKVWRTGWSGMFLSFLSPIWRLKQMERSYLRQADRMITVVDEAKEHYVGDCDVAPEKVTVVMNVEDLDYFYSLPVKKIKEYLPSFNILYIGGFGIHRGIQTAILAMPKILREIPNARLLLVGSGSDEDKLKRLAKDIGVSEAVEFCGQQPFTLVPSYIAASHVCLVPHIASGHSDSTIPHKLFQYMAMAKPVIVSSAKPLTRIVEETGAGLVYPSGDANGLAGATIKVYSHRGLAINMGMAGRKAVEERYNWRKEGEKLVRLYQDLGGV